MTTINKPQKVETIHWNFHPRVFTSLGAELVTNDLVALVELVKNAYDAFAHRVDIRFIKDEETGDQTIEIQDDGHGMDHKTILNSWCMIGTPHKADNKSVDEGRKTRRVTGEKGLGRLSAARLGGKLCMYTKEKDGPCYRVNVDWDAIAKAKTLAECIVEIQLVQPPEDFGEHGTLLRIQKLRDTWDFNENSDLPDLQTELTRFVPPFRKQTDFLIYINFPGKEQKPARIQPPEMLSHPTYLIKGLVDKHGILTVEYKYRSEDQKRRLVGKMNLTEEEPRLRPDSISFHNNNLHKTKSGPFDFEFRVWDFDRESLFDLAERFNLPQKRNAIRNLVAHSPYNGISIYRDGVLVLPKDIGDEQKRKSGSHDWLGLNLRRVSRLGTRISMSQIIGYINISADGNPGLRDTADRERLVDNPSSRQLRQFLFRIIALLEQERDKDRTEPAHQEPPLQDLFAALRSPTLPQKLFEIEERKGGWDEINQAVTEHTKELDTVVGEIQQRFYYYSRLASVGSLAMLLQHEVGNKVSIISELNNYLRENLESITGLRFLQRRLELSENAVRTLQRLADIFSPLASRTFGTRRRNSILEEIILQLTEWHEKEMHHLQVRFRIDSSGPTKVAVDPGELTSIIDNLFTNSLYWLKKVPEKEREILVEIFPSKDGTRTAVRFHDSGPGVEDELEEKIFWPGVTKKEGGIGMGLTVASELVAQRNGKMYLIKPGDIGGASFGFDLPLARIQQGNKNE